MAFMSPETIVSQFHLRPGDRTTDLGAGSGHSLQALSRAVGDRGRVFAIEIQRPLAEALTERARKERLSNVEVIWGDIEKLHGTKIADQSLDSVILMNVLSMLENREGALGECARILKQGGKVHVVDWTDSFGGLGPIAPMIVTEAAARALFEKHDFAYERSYPAGDHHYGMSFRKQ
jgi:arsenite methyltransferase